MPRKINPALSQAPLIGEEEAPKAKPAPVGKPKAEEPVAKEPKPEFKYDEAIKEIIETNPIVSRNKDLKDSLKNEMLENGKDVIETEYGTAKISESEKNVLDEEGLIRSLKENGLSKYVKTKTIEYIDHDEIESIIYNHGEDGDALNSVVAANTSTQISKTLRVSAPKKKKGE